MNSREEIESDNEPLIPPKVKHVKEDEEIDEDEEIESDNEPLIPPKVKHESDTLGSASDGSYPAYVNLEPAPGTEINWTDFNQTLPHDDDYISLSYENAPDQQSDEITFLLETTRNVTWSKEIAIYYPIIDRTDMSHYPILNGRWGIGEKVETKDEDHGPKRITVKKGSLYTKVQLQDGMHYYYYYLVFSKGKILNYLTPMYKVSLETLPESSTFHFIWKQDDPSNHPFEPPEPKPIPEQCKPIYEDIERLNRKKANLQEQLKHAPPPPRQELIDKIYEINEQIDIKQEELANCIKQNTHSRRTPKRENSKAGTSKSPFSNRDVDGIIKPEIVDFS